MSTARRKLINTANTLIGGMITAHPAHLCVEGETGPGIRDHYPSAPRECGMETFK